MLPELNVELFQSTVEQLFSQEKLKLELEKMSKVELENSLMSIYRQLQIKDNIIKYKINKIKLIN